MDLLSKLEEEFRAMATSCDTINILYIYHIEHCEQYEMAMTPCYVLNVSVISQKNQNCSSNPKNDSVNLVHLSKIFC